jgi:2-desacetyl-2-hydroxyethyl bacteriochlorophyllide A dehydrogenase
MKRQAVYFVRPQQAEVRDEPALPKPGTGQVIIQTMLSAISAGTEMLIYRGQAPTELVADESITALSGSLSFPIKYGYCTVGRVLQVGSGVPKNRTGTIVFAFNPHETHFVTNWDDVIPLPDEVSPEDALFLPNMETAVNLVMDARPMIGERAVVFGQGIVGLLTTALLSEHPLSQLITIDRYTNRREASTQMRASASLDPVDPGFLTQLRNQLGNTGADVCIEISGAPEALDQAIKVTGYTGRVIIGSWYGTKQARLDLGGSFHRSRVKLISSQVSTINPDLTGRWTKQRRFEVAWDAIRRLHPSRLITHRIPFDQAAEAYKLCDQRPGDAIQVILDYGALRE